MLDLTGLFRTYARRRLRQLAVFNPAEAQHKELQHLLGRAQATSFGKAHSFAQIRTVSDFQKRVPLRDYETFWREWWRPSFPRLVNVTWPGITPYFAMTSGTTTGRTKYIPVSKEIIRSNVRAGMQLLSHHVCAVPDSRIWGGRIFMLGGTTDLREMAPGILSGDLSGIVAKTEPWWIRQRAFPPHEIAGVSNWHRKVDLLARSCFDADIRAIAGVPSWLLSFFAQVEKIEPQDRGHLVNWFPDLELVVHGGVNFAPYRASFEPLLAGGRAELREAYSASEGFIAVADRNPGEGLRLLVDNGLFFEFVPCEELGAQSPRRHWVATVEPDVDYAVVISSNAGLWGYILGDTIRFVDTVVPRILVTGRTSYTLSAFGEHVIDAEIAEAVALAAERSGEAILDYSVGPLYPSQAGDPGRHLYIVEFAAGVPTVEQQTHFAEALDANIRASNCDYEVLRSSGSILELPAVRTVQPGTFSAWMEKRGQIGGQHKVPRILTDETLFSDLLDFTSKRR